MLASSRHLWPIHPDAGQTPNGWTGWPEGKQFAVVLTHDVESGVGVERVPPLADLERDLGFRSSFNFVGGDYPVPAGLLDELRLGGFEVGVHGFHHNGLMYLTRRIFSRHARGINRRLKEWRAVGFRSPAMHRNFEWIHDLDVLYDCSSFDTDPFEPQPEGVATIFPFWVVDRQRKRAYVELPYTLPQDFTLFSMLEEKTNEIWERKLDWVARNGGMALLNTHPDYMTLGGKSTKSEYPARHYTGLLEYIRREYKDLYWQALPREAVAHFVSVFPREEALS